MEVVNQHEMLGDLRTIHLKGFYPPGPYDLEVWIAPDHGFLPVKSRLVMVREEQKLELIEELSELRKLENGLWYPMRVKDTVNDIAERTVFYEVTSISVAPLKVTDFQPEFPPGTHVHDLVTGQKFMIPLPPSEENGDGASRSNRPLEEVEREVDAYIHEAMRSTSASPSGRK